MQFLRVHFDMSFAWNGVHGILLLSSRAHACTMNNTCPSAHATDITTPSGSHNTCAGHHSHKSQVDEKNSKNCAQKHNAAQVCAVRWAHCRRAGRHAAPACHCREHKCPCSMHIVGAPTSAVSAAKGRAVTSSADARMAAAMQLGGRAVSFEYGLACSSADARMTAAMQLGGRAHGPP